MKQRIHSNVGNGKVINLSPLSGYLYAEIEGKGLMKLELKDVQFDREVAKAMKAEEAVSRELKVLEEDYEE